MNWKFEKNKNNINGLWVEIWHGIISPNTWNKEDNIDEIKKYFSKNNDYYNWEGLFAEDKWVLNWDFNFNFICLLLIESIKLSISIRSKPDI